MTQSLALRTRLGARAKAVLAEQELESEGLARLVDLPAIRVEKILAGDLAYLLVVRACADIDRAARDRQPLDVRTRGRIRMDAGQAAKLCREAINRLLSVNGAGSFALVNHLQRVWRDSEVASRHAFVLPEMASLIYGRALFGIEEIIQPF